MDFEADWLAGEWMVEVEEGAAVGQFTQEAGEIRSPVGRTELDQRVHLEFDVRRQRAARNPFDEARVVGAEGVHASEIEGLPRAGGESEQAVFERFGQLATTHLQGGRREIEGADVLAAIAVGEAVVQRQVAVVADGWGGTCRYFGGFHELP